MFRLCLKNDESEYCPNPLAVIALALCIILALFLFASSAFAQGPITPSPRNQFEKIGVGGAPSSSSLINVPTGWGNGAAINNIPVYLNQSYFGTDKMATDVISFGIQSTSTFGNGGIASIGTVSGITSAISIQGSGSNSNEYDTLLLAMRTDIGTGYTQSTGPVGRLWMVDSGVHGSIAVQPNLMQGYSAFMNNYYNGSPSASPACVVCIMTKAGVGPAIDSLHAAATTYPIDIGMLVAGDSTGANNGFTTGIQVGGASGLTGWSTNTSHIGTGLRILNTATNAIYIGPVSDSGPDIFIERATANISLGRTDTASTPFIDVNSSGNAVDYDYRSIYSGGGATLGSGSLTLDGGATLFKYQGGSNTVVIDHSGGGVRGAYFSDVALGVRLYGASAVWIMDDGAGGAAQLQITGLKTAGAAGGKQLVCADPATGRLYLSTNGASVLGAVAPCAN